MRIVGRGVVPEGNFNELGQGAALTFQAYRRLDPGAQPYSFEARIAPGADRQATLARLERKLRARQRPGRRRPSPTSEGCSELPLVVSALLVAIAAAVLAHALVMAIRRRRRHLAVLKTLGFDRRQVFATVAWQATTFAALGLAVGSRSASRSDAGPGLVRGADRGRPGTGHAAPADPARRPAAVLLANLVRPCRPGAQRGRARPLF